MSSGLVGADCVGNFACERRKDIALADNPRSGVRRTDDPLGDEEALRARARFAAAASSSTSEVAVGLAPGLGSSSL